MRAQVRNETSKSTCSNELANIPLKAPLAALLAKELPCIERVGGMAAGRRAHSRAALGGRRSFFRARR